jgi:transposase
VTPIHKHLFRRDKVSAISAVTVSPRRRRLGLYFQLHRHNIRRDDVCTFVRYLLRHLRGHVIVIWDNLNTHKGEPIRDLCRRYPRLRIEYLPGYAPELNPDEGVWGLAKRQLANSSPEDIGELQRGVRRCLVRVKRSQRHLRGCIRQSELPYFFP